MDKIECPSEIAEQLLIITECGIANIRYFLENNDCVSGVIEANHIHNIPNIINKFSYSLLTFYLDIEVKEYTEKAAPQLSIELMSNWEVLRKWGVKQEG